MSNDLQNLTRYAILYLHVDQNIEGLPELYDNHVALHNQAMLTDPFPNSGFDIFCPKAEWCNNVQHPSTMVNFRVKAEMRLFDEKSQSWRVTAYYMYPRSSLSKTPLMLANHTGIIDSGYRGNLIGAFRNLDIVSNTAYVIEPNTRLLQICAPDLRPILVKCVDEQFYESTDRGAGGFGSTGI
jgi:dUTPase